MNNVEIFDKIFGEVSVVHNCEEWYEVFDSELMDEVNEKICKYFGVENACDIEGYSNWYDEMYWDL